MSFQEELKEYILSQGATDVGFSRPGDGDFGECEYAVSIVVKLSESIVDEIEDEPTHTYFNHYRTVNSFIDELLLKTGLFLDRHGYKYITVAASQSINKKGEWNYNGRYSHKRAAVHAGLGTIGKNSMFLHNQYGTAVRLGTIFTNCKFDVPDALPQSKCGKCSRCVDACPAHAITGREWTPECTRDDMFIPERCSEYMKKAFQHIGRGAVCGICMKVCPSYKDTTVRRTADMFYNKPIFFERNRVFRVYTGGALFADFFGDKREDGFYPEEWVASSVRALNEGHDDEYEGVSKIEGSEMHLNDAIKAYGREILGEKKNIGVLTKILDSAIRLPAQAHPDRAFAKEHFGSVYGKQEAWLILGTRPGAKLFYGFKNGVTRQQLEQAVEKSEDDKEIMASLMESYEVKAGDIVFIPAGIAHAIGEGCLLLEVQEPTDFTIQPERWCGEYRLSDNEMYIGLDKKTALDCFKMDLKHEIPLEKLCISDSNGVKIESAIDGRFTDCFSLEIVTFTGGEYTLDKCAGVYVVTDGEGIIKGENYERVIKKGDYFLLPRSAAGEYKIYSDSMTLAAAEGY
ncbi:MAG: 4Fe-4S binding protein [Clostridia bacterium]|nr:4Fe-4S binding protein [Clostridia bacterium]